MHKQSRRKDDEVMTTKMKNCFVKFFVVGTVTGPNRWEVIVGCLESNEIYLCLDDWKSNSFVTLAVSGQFASQERQSYRFQVEGQLKFLEEYNDHLELLPGETSYQSILVEVSQSIDAAPLGRINIYTEGDQTSRLVTELPLPLTADMEASLRIEAASHQENNTEHVVSSFFGGVVKEMSLDNSLFKQLGLSDAERKRISDDTAATDTEYRMFVMLYQCCERQGDKAAFLRKFLVALDNVQQHNAKHCLVESIKCWLAVSTPDEDDEIFAQELSAIVNDFAEQGLITLPGDYRNTTYVETRNCKEKVLRNMEVSLDMTRRVGAPKTFLRLSYSEPEDNPHGLVAKMNEAFWGDLVEWCISTTTIGLTIVFHLQDGPGRYAELVLKYATFGHTQEEALVETLFIPEEQRWEATSQISVGSRGWFVLCTRPKETRIEVPVDGCTIVYALDERVKIVIPKNAFECPGSMCLKVVDMEYNGNDLEAIISLSTFYDISHTSGDQPQEDITVTLPLPEKYTGEGQLLVLSRPGQDESDDESEDESEEVCEEEATRWTILDTVISVNDNVATFSTHHFSENVLGEYRKNVPRQRVKKQTRLHRRRGVKYHVVFAAWGKGLFSSAHDVVVECCHRKDFKKRSETWLNKGYSCLRVSSEFRAKAKSTYRIGICGNAKSLYDISKLKLIYQRGMAPFQSMHLKILNEKYSPLAAIAIMDGKANIKTYLPFELDQEVYSENSRTVVQKTALDATASNGHGYEDVEDFIRDTLMDTLPNEVFESWWKVWIYAGVPLAKLIDFVANPQFSSLSRTKQMFHDWLLGHAGKNDYGLTDLIKALIRAECKSAAQFVVNHLQKCLNSGAFKNKPFGKWLKAQNLKLKHIGSVNDAAEPMSDVFLIDILQYFGVDCEFLGIECGLTTQERRDLSEPHPFGRQFQLFTLLCKVRQKAQYPHEGLRVLLKALQQLNLNATKESIILLTKKWLDTKGESKQKDAKSFLDVIKQFTDTSSLD